MKKLIAIAGAALLASVTPSLAHGRVIIAPSFGVVISPSGHEYWGGGPAWRGVPIYGPAWGWVGPRRHWGGHRIYRHHRHHHR
jgi:hypothetical protein